MRRVEHSLNTMLQVPSGPGALQGLSLAMFCSSYLLVIDVIGVTGLKYMASLGMVETFGVGGKNNLARAQLFSLLSAVSYMVPSAFQMCKVGICAFPPSVGSAVMYLLATHILLHIICSNHSIQCFFLVLWIASEYSFWIHQCSL